MVKKRMIELLLKYPIVEAACNKAGISRSTHYEWLQKDPDYRNKVEMALEASIATVNDVAESNIISKVKGGDFKATAYWLEHRHPAYAKNPQPKILRLVLKPRPSPDFVAAVRKYDPSYTPATEDIYMTEDEWLLEKERIAKKSDTSILNERFQIDE